MICFLTSTTGIPDQAVFNPANRFTEALRACYPDSCSVLYVCSAPRKHRMTDYYASIMRQSLMNADLPFRDFTVLDSRNRRQAAELVKKADLIVLTGGHVPTQNRFFEKIGLRELLKEYQGIIIGISAGSMNSADVVYAQPEEKGEGRSRRYRRFLTGLNLTKTMIIPHYQMTKDLSLDGKKLFEDITFPDSMGRTFYAISDGSYLFIKDGKEELRGEAYKIQDGVISKIAEEGEVVHL